jgi:uncharacterized protein YuzE
MKIKNFQNTDTLLDLDSRGSICAMTIEHSSTRADIPHFSFEQVAVARTSPLPSYAH